MLMLMLLFVCVEGDVFVIEGVVNRVVEVDTRDVNLPTEEFQIIFNRFGGCSFRACEVLLATKETVEIFGGRFAIFVFH